MTIHIFGEAMLEYHSGGSSGGLRYGGDTLNTAIHLARMGHDVRYVTAVGTDRISDALVAAWQAEGIDTRYVLRHPSRNPGIYAIYVDGVGERSFLYWRDHSAAREMFLLDGMHEAVAAAEAGSLLYFSLISLAILPLDGRDSLLALAGRCRASGCRVAYDSNFRANLWPSLVEARRISEQAVAIADIGLPTNTDESELAGIVQDELAIVQRWQLLGCSEVVLKSGERGCLISNGNEAPISKAVRPIAMIDSSGAGDAFNGGYLAARLKGKSSEDSTELGHALAAWVIQRRGTVPAIDDEAPYSKK
ncbi:MAG: sugar kinase [Pontixanthobacter sp.]